MYKTTLTLQQGWSYKAGNTVLVGQDNIFMVMMSSKVATRPITCIVCGCHLYYLPLNNEEIKDVCYCQINFEPTAVYNMHPNLKAFTGVKKSSVACDIYCINPYIVYTFLNSLLENNHLFSTNKKLKSVTFLYFRLLEFPHVNCWFTKVSLHVLMKIHQFGTSTQHTVYSSYQTCICC